MAAVEGYYKNSEKDYQAFGRFHAFRVNRLRTFLTALIALALAAVLVALTFILRVNMITAALLCLILALIMPPVTYFAQYLKIKKNIRRNVNFSATTNEYAFGETLRVTVSAGKRSESNELGYDVFYRAYETRNYFFLYVNPVSAFILPKRCITTGGADALAALLAEKLGARFRGRRAK